MKKTIPIVMLLIFLMSACLKACAPSDSDKNTPIEPTELASTPIISVDENIILKNEISNIYGNQSMENYKVEGSVKIINSMLDEDDYNTSFEIVLRRQTDGTNIGRGGTACIYRIEAPPYKDYMRIEDSTGTEIDIKDGEWHRFSATIVGKQIIFRLDDETQYYYMSDNTFAKGGFALRAVNCEVEVKDVVMSSISSPINVTAQNRKIAADKEYLQVTGYNAVDLKKETAIALYEDDVKKSFLPYEGGLSWEIVEGADIAELIESNIIRFKKQVKNGRKVMLKATAMSYLYDGLSCNVTISVKKPAGSEEDYVSKGVKSRQENLLRILAKIYGKTTDFNNINQLAYAFGQIVLYPEEKNYDEEIEWMISLTKSDSDVTLAGGDFAVNQLITIYKMLNGKIKISDNVKNKMINTIKSFEYITPDKYAASENHILANLTGGLLTCETFPDAVMYNKKTGKSNADMYREMLKDWINYRLKRGLLEFDAGYTAIDYYYLGFLHAFTEDQELRVMAEDCLEYLFADMAVDSVDGIPGGAHGRGYANKLEIMNSISGIFNIFFDNTPFAFDTLKNKPACQIAPLAVCSYRPSAILSKIARDSEKRFYNMEKRTIYHLPDDYGVTETLKKYTHVTPEYSLGSIVQSDLGVKTGAQYNYRKASDRYHRLPGVISTGTWIAQGHQETLWSLYIGKSPVTFIFDSHPGSGETDSKSKHNYFTGDYNCHCSKYFQDENVLIGMHKIGKDLLSGKDKPKLSHFWLPRSVFEKVVEEDGWIFVKQYNTYVAIKPLKDGIVSAEKQYTWGNTSQKFASTGLSLSELEVKVQSADTAFVCQVADTTEFKGTFEEFKKEVKKCRIDYSTGADDDYYIEFTGLNGKTLKLEYNSDKRFINGKEQDVNSYKLQDSPYLQADWDKGEIVMKYGKEKKVIKMR